MILMIDNYDSFTYNLVQFLGELGEELIVKRNDDITLEEIEALSPDFLMISPGPCSPNEAGISLMRSVPLQTGSRSLVSASVINRSLKYLAGCRPCRTADARKSISDVP